MAPADHNKALGILHLAYGGFSVFLMGMISIFVLGTFGVLAINQSGGEAVPLGLMAAIMVFVGLINVLIIGPSFLAGYALLKKKRWAKTVGIIAGVLAGMSFPFGTAVCVYTCGSSLGKKEGRSMTRWRTPCHRRHLSGPLQVTSNSRCIFHPRAHLIGASLTRSF